MFAFRRNVGAVSSLIARRQPRLDIISVLPQRYTPTPSLARTFAVSNVAFKPFGIKEKDDSGADEFDEDSSDSRFAESRARPPRSAVSRDDASNPTPNKVFVANLPYKLDESGLQDVFQDCGEVVNVNLHRDSVTGSSLGRAHITFSTPDAAQAALGMDQTGLEGRLISVQVSFARKESAGTRSPSEPSNVLFVGGLSYTATTEDVEDAFSDFGPVTVRVGSSNDGRPRGFAHVEFETVEAAQEALEKANGREISGRSVRLDFAGKGANRERSPRGGNFGRERGGYEGRDNRRRGDRDGFGREGQQERRQWRPRAPSDGGSRGFGLQ